MFINRLESALAAVVIGALVPTTPASAQALKTAGSCHDEYKGQKAALDAVDETEEDFIAACRASPVGTPTPIGGSAAPSPAPGYVPPSAAPRP